MNSFGFPPNLVKGYLIKRMHRLARREIFQHEPEVSRFLKTLKGDLFVDVGANFGYYSFLLHENFHRILAIEPHPFNVAIMYGVKRKYGYHKVEILQIALCDKDGTARLYIGKHSGGHSLISSSGNDCFTVKTKTLASVVKHPIDLIKVDVEGAEWQILEGATPILHEIKKWVVELHNPEEREKLEEWFRSHSYSIEWLDFKGKTGNHIYAWR